MWGRPSYILFGDMGELNQPASRRTFRWPGAARGMVRTYLDSATSALSGKDEHGAQVGLGTLITRIAAVSGNPRGVCWRFVRQSGVTSKRSYRQWTRAEQQKLLDLIASRSLREVTMLLRRSPTSVRALLHQLGAGSRMGQDWFTKHALAEALRVREEEVQKWIDRGLLLCRTVETSGLQRQIIDAEDFCDFCKTAGQIAPQKECQPWCWGQKPQFSIVVSIVGEGHSLVAYQRLVQPKHSAD
jgi:hypothetical protein